MRQVVWDTRLSRRYGGYVSRAKNPFELAALATVALPGLKVVAIRPPSYSDDVQSVTGIVDAEGNRWTVTCPHSSVGGLDLEAQSTILQRLGMAFDHRKIPFNVPRPAGSTLTSEGDRILVHKDLGGRAMTDADFEDERLLPASLGRALAALHNLNPLAYTGAGLPSYDADECRTRHLAVLDEAAKETLIPANLWDRWEAAFDDVSLWRFATAPVHADLQTSSVFVEGGSVVAMTGFHGAHVGDPATDIAWVLAQASDAFLERFREAYSMDRSATDLHVFTRAQLLSELALVRWLVHGIRAGDRQIRRDAERMLHDHAKAVGDEQLVSGRHSSATPPPPPEQTADSAESERSAGLTSSARAERAERSPEASQDTSEQVTPAGEVDVHNLPTQPLFPRD